MAKVLTAISRDSPASPLSVSVNDTFSFAGTPTLSGGGGAQRYDFRWEVNPGSGYVPISGSTGLTTANTNPLVNTNSQTQNAITVTCAQAGTYTIRMAGAPTSGGSYTVFSPTQSVTVAMAAITGSLAAQESGADTAAATGTATVSGSAAASESGPDVFAGSGSVEADSVTGSMAAQESGADTLSASGAATIAGVLAATDTGADSAAGSGAVSVSGTLSATDAVADTFAASGDVEAGSITGSMDALEAGADACAALGGAEVIALFAAQEFGLDALEANGPPAPAPRLRKSYARVWGKNSYMVRRS